MSLFRQPLFNPRLLEKRLKVEAIPPAHAHMLHGWADTIRDSSILLQKETAIRRPFLSILFEKVLGYRSFGQGERWTIHDEQGAAKGSMDTALGLFSAVGSDKIVAPFELKGPDTVDLDAIMPGRHKSPVQQAWEYANDTPGCRFVLVSNMVELRLYAVGYGREAYETWRIADLINPGEYARLQLLLGAEQLLSGNTQALLEASAGAEKEITQKLYREYRTLRVQLVISLAQSNPGLELTQTIEHAQKILDRVLFVAFAEDRGLLPEKTIERAFQSRNAFNPQPVWENFKGLFRAIDKGNAALAIPAYNGGLFAEDTVLDALCVGDDICQSFKELGEYDFNTEVSVTVLGHIFENSVADLEELREAAGTGQFELKAKEQIERGSTRSVKGRRKDEGVVYTPDHITGFIVEQALGGYLNAEFEARLRNYVVDPESPRNGAGEITWKRAGKNDPVRKQLPRTAKGRGAGAAKGDVEERAYEYLFWRDWLEFLKSVTVVDPACGSGAFLVAAFDWLHAEYRRVTEQLHAITGSYDLFDLNKAILNGNLYGVDLNAESVEITKLSLWLKTAERGKPLTSLEANIHLGNSLIRGQEFSARAFDWQAAFPQAFARGGFDVVIGNPPYVRMERIKPIKPYLEKHYDVASDRADLYAYFYELGVKLLKPGGRLGYISSSSFLKTGSGERLRMFLRAHTRLRTLVDFGDMQVFEGVTTYPVVLVAEKLPAAAAADANAPIDYLVLDQSIASLSAAFQRTREQMPQAQLGAGSWQIESPRLAALRRKLTLGHPTLKDVYGSPCRGVVTGLNEAFVIDRATRDDLIRRDPSSKELLKPFLVGEDLKKWRIEPQDQWLIYIPKNSIAIDDYPAIRDHLVPFRDKLEKRATKQEWFELQQAQAAYAPQMEKPKIIYGHFSSSALFSHDSLGYYSNDKSYFIPHGDWYLLGLLNSSTLWWQITRLAPFVRGGYYEVRVQYIETLPIPANNNHRAQIGALAKACQQTAEQRRDLRNQFRRRIPDLAPGGVNTLPGVLHDWWKLDFAEFQKQVKKAFKRDIALAERNAWQNYLDTERAKVLALDAEIARLEGELNTAVYALFDLNTEDVQLLESTLRRAPAAETATSETA